MMGRGGIGVRVGVYYNLYSDGYGGGRFCVSMLVYMEMVLDVGTALLYGGRCVRVLFDSGVGRYGFGGPSV